MEALKFKRPVLVADTSALREMAERGLVRSVSLQSGPQQVAQAILEQLDRPLIPPDVHIPSWDDCAEQLLSVYEDVIGST
jgi:glycosyltransferase involved in cell wall biosynthesis